jgi:glycosyltransferase involved in cell wall biosynthesis
MTLIVLMAIGLFFTCFTLVMTLINLRIYAKPASLAPADDTELISIAIPARNEQANIEPCVRSLLASTHRNLEVLVYNDQSTDRTGEIIDRLMRDDARVRAVETKPLPPGWNGKQWGCDNMGRAARGSWVLFTDADVRFSPDCLSAALASARTLKCDLLSTFPRQVTGTISESLTVPMIHFILLSYLPFPRMRTTRDPSASAGCGQFLLVRREAYLSAGGHEPFKGSMHDGIKLPRTMRKAGFSTDLFDATALCSVRMYRGLAQVWRGFTKNAFEGLGSIGLLIFVTLVHALAFVLPWALLACAAAGAGVSRHAIILAITAIIATLIHRIVLALRFQQSWLGVALHPIAIITMALIQWHSWLLHVTGKRSWKGRAQ